ncbi:uncharacterized protein L199_002864 [Kwoniella botswanensis]|uniref:uncharacterized protein n=1 Tax=Kwoniella botswanensis TaxID=1268659 RepID=UPI00315C9C48
MTSSDNVNPPSIATSETLFQGVGATQTTIRPAKNYSQSRNTEEDFEEMIIPRYSREPEIFVEKLKRMMTERREGDCTWIRLYGMDDKLVKGITELCGLATWALLKHFLLSRPKRRCPHYEIHPSYTVIQFPVYGTSSTIREAVLEACCLPKKRPISLPADPKESRLPLEHREVDDMLKSGLISTFIIPSANVVVTITPQNYICPATRMMEFAARTMHASSDTCLATDATLLSLSLIHRAVGYASGTVVDFTRLIEAWEMEARRSTSTTRTEEIHRLLLHLQLFKARLRELGPIHQDLMYHYGQKISSEDIDASTTSNQAVILLEQGEKGRQRVLDDLQDLMDRMKSLEDFCFNMLSSRANDSMERLAIVTIVFLPLTFIASYFSMGFKDFSVLEQTPTFFWKISIPLSFAFFLIFAYATLKRLCRYTITIIKRGIKTTRSTESFKRLKCQWWDKPANRARREQMVRKLQGIFKGFRTQDLPPPSYMPRERLRPYTPTVSNGDIYPPPVHRSSGQARPLPLPPV